MLEKNYGIHKIVSEFTSVTVISSKNEFDHHRRNTLTSMLLLILVVDSECSTKLLYNNVNFTQHGIPPSVIYVGGILIHASYPPTSSKTTGNLKIFTCSETLTPCYITREGS